MSDTNFYRTYYIKAGQKGKTGLMIGDQTDVTNPVLHVAFSVEKSDSSSNNTATVQIWNLSSKSIKVLEKKNAVLYLYAGYNNQNALILAGNISAVSTTRDNADKVTEISVVDGLVALRDTYMVISRNGKVNSKTLYNLIAKKMGVTIKFAKGLKFKNIPKGFSFSGKAKTALTKVAKANNHSWTIQNGVLQITKKGGSLSSKGYVISPDTGLINEPKKVSLSSDSSDSSTTTKSGWEVDFFLNGSIGINDVIVLKSDEVNAYCRVKKLTFTGDNVQGDWLCTAELEKIKKL